MELEPSTLAAIHSQGELSDAQTPSQSGRMWRCGCECRYGVQWRLCAFHQGFDAGAEAARTARDYPSASDGSVTGN